MSEGVRGSSQGLRESEAPARAPVRFLGSQRVQSVSESEKLTRV